ncbi:MAG TPA: tRNA (adenosine(37)-N6)-threonylcarbamoyltransferase complex transferase subunit TsaD [Chthoniobacterales bacterium]|nr:tRNA (adenosine(37)-N6)-threonylcarbamoyltransferase complex transferase subunit TsaD [Chthoniobacterales bacterium]
MNDQPLILALETSCDETAVAILRGRELLVSEVASQTAAHEPYGGVVPEVASRNHLLHLPRLLERAVGAAGIFSLRDVDAFAATSGPGLATSLMIGASAAKGLALGAGKPYLAINHLEGHLLSPFFGRNVEPNVALIVSGGHTLLAEVRGVDDYRLLGRTVDDAAGEAFDKVAKLLGLGYPGGPEIERRAASGDAMRFDLPRTMLDSGDFNFSFSGLKTAVRYLIAKLPADALHSDQTLDDLCASFQRVANEVLVRKTISAAKNCNANLVTLSGGVSCNNALRSQMESACNSDGLRFVAAPRSLTTDNAAMIAFAAALRFEARQMTSVTEEIDPNLALA